MERSLLTWRLVVFCKLPGFRCASRVLAHIFMFATAFAVAACSLGTDVHGVGERPSSDDIPRGNAESVVLLLVDSGTYSSISRDIDQYVEAVSASMPVSIVVDHRARYEELQPEDIRAVLREHHERHSIDGVILVGRLPYALWEQYWDDANYGVNSFYYEDLDGTWSDTDNDGYHDLHAWGSNEGPEIFVSWVYPSSNNPIGELRSFFRKAHDYHTGGMHYRKRALVALHSDWARDMDDFAAYYPQLTRIYGAESVDRMGGYEGGQALLTDGDAYLAMIENTYEMALFYTHAMWMMHQSDVNDVSVEEIAANDGGSLITFVGGCHSGDFFSSPTGLTITSAYVFGAGIGLAATGTTWNYGPEELWVVTDRLHNGATLGAAWLAKQRMRNTPSSYRKRFVTPAFDSDRHMFGEILFGDPFVHIRQ